MTRTLALLLALCAALCAQTPPDSTSPAVTADELWLKLTLSGSRKLLGLVVADFTIPDGTAPATAGSVRELNAVFRADLSFSLHFTIAQPDSGVVWGFSTDPKKPDYKGWSTTGAQVLCCADLQVRRSGNALALRLYDLASARLIASKTYGLTDNPRWLAHQMADEVVKQLTGEDGVSRTRIAYSQVLNSQTKELALIDYDGANQALLTGSGGLKLYPDWSPRADRIAFCTFSQSSLDLRAFELATRRSVVLSGRSGLNSTPAYSPDGKHIAFALSSDGNSDIHLMDVNGRGLKRLTAGAAIDVSPCWDPSGRQIAFVSDRTGTPQVYVMNADGTDLRRVTFEGSYNTSPAWSPRGDLIAFVQRQPGGVNQVCVTNILGDTYMRLTSRGNNEDPCWSPDGLHIAFSSNRLGHWEVFTMNWNGANQQQVTRTGGALSPAWSPRLTR